MDDLTPTSPVDDGRETVHEEGNGLAATDDSSRPDTPEVDPHKGSVSSETGHPATTITPAPPATPQTGEQAGSSDQDRGSESPTPGAAYTEADSAADDADSTDVDTTGHGDADVSAASHETGHDAVADDRDPSPSTSSPPSPEQSTDGSTDIEERTAETDEAGPDEAGTDEADTDEADTAIQGIDGEGAHSVDGEFDLLAPPDSAAVADDVQATDVSTSDRNLGEFRPRRPIAVDAVPVSEINAFDDEPEYEALNANALNTTDLRSRSDEAFMGWAPPAAPVDPTPPSPPPPAVDEPRRRRAVAVIAAVIALVVAVALVGLVRGAGEETVESTRPGGGVSNSESGAPVTWSDGTRINADGTVTLPDGATFPIIERRLDGSIVYQGPQGPVIAAPPRPSGGSNSGSFGGGAGSTEPGGSTPGEWIPNPAEPGGSEWVPNPAEPGGGEWIPNPAEPGGGEWVPNP